MPVPDQGLGHHFYCILQTSHTHIACYVPLGGQCGAASCTDAHHLALLGSLLDLCDEPLFLGLQCSALSVKLSDSFVKGPLVLSQELCKVGQCESEAEVDEE